MARTASCVVYAFDCAKEADRTVVAFLQGVAAAQKLAFATIFPWEGACHHHRAYVALTFGPGTHSRPTSASPAALMHLFRTKTKGAAPVICGWLNAFVQREKGRTHAYLSEVAARAIKDTAFKGVGAMLVRALEADAAAQGIDFIHLRPLSDVVGFYEKLGYVFLPPANHLMFKVFKKPPMTKWLAEQKPEVISDDDITNAILEEVKALDAKAHRKLVERFKKDPGAVFEMLALYEERGEAADVIEAMT